MGGWEFSARTRAWATSDLFSARDSTAKSLEGKEWFVGRKVFRMAEEPKQRTRLSNETLTWLELHAWTAGVMGALQCQSQGWWDEL